MAILVRPLVVVVGHLGIIAMSKSQHCTMHGDTIRENSQLSLPEHCNLHLHNQSFCDRVQSHTCACVWQRYQVMCRSAYAQISHLDADCLGLGEELHGVLESLSSCTTGFHASEGHVQITHHPTVCPHSPSLYRKYTRVHTRAHAHTHTHVQSTGMPITHHKQVITHATTKPL